MHASPITATVDLEQEGVRHGFLKLPHSHDASAWGSLMIPMTVARRSDGPTVLLTGGNHGDEYEGPVALFDLASRVHTLELRGRTIIVPAMNYPAFRAGRRTSPIDGVNLNRAFPGDPRGSVTQKLADYFQQVLLPMADVVVDLHSGGKSLDFVPFCAAHVLPDPVQQSRCVAAMRAFNAPYSVMQLEMDSVGLFDTAAEEMGKTFISTELGGGGTARAGNVAIARRGVENVLRHVGILPGEPEVGPSRELQMPDERCFVTAAAPGLLEFVVELGSPVNAGQQIARVYDVTRSGAPPTSYHAGLDGVLLGRHFPGLVEIGDVVAVVGVENAAAEA